MTSSIAATSQLDTYTSQTDPPSSQQDTSNNQLSTSTATPTVLQNLIPILPSLNPNPLQQNQLTWGSWHCERFKVGGKCDFCSHMKETDHVKSFYYITKFRIYGHLRHDYSPEGKIRWFIYCVEDVPCKKHIVGSTQDPLSQWRNYKSTCNSENSKSTGLANHFKDGCPFDTGKEKSTLVFTLIDFYDTTKEKLERARHVPEPYCQCKECGHLKDLKDC